MGVFQRLGREFTILGGFLRTLKAYGKIGKDSDETVGDDIERTVDKFPDRPAIRFEGKTTTYAEFDAQANRYARWALAQGLKRGDVVVLFMHNRPDFLACWMGLSKVGIATALINTNLIGSPLAHCTNIAESDHVVLDCELAQAFAGAQAQLTRKPKVWAFGGDYPGAENLDAALAAQDPARIPRKQARDGMKGGQLALYVYTSGTTGAPKAARIPHWRAQGFMRVFIGATQPTEQDKNYLTLPLYHATGGLCGVGVMLNVGGCLILKKRFSASQFWQDVYDEQATMFFYVGELCRYLTNAPPHPHEADHKVRAIVGNGLRPDVWEKFQERFKIPHIYEFYGSTEGNVSMLNFDGKPGAVGRIPPYLRVAGNVKIVKFDVESEKPVRGPNGLCIEAKVDEVGEALGEIRENNQRYRFEGYTGDKAQTEKKILRDVFKKGDAWFRTGDLMKQDEEGYFYFVDRIGDTFRWKGENVSTTEVAEAVSSFPGIEEANVYGVQIGQMDGRAGMAALHTTGTVDLDGLRVHLINQLPPFARPLFIRMQQQIDTTGTVKYRKIGLVQEGFDPSKTSDAIWFDHPVDKRFVRVTPELYAEICAGKLKL